jgi:hypothetical protein
MGVGSFNYINKKNMKKFNKILLYDFVENLELKNIPEKYSNDIILIKATDDYQNILNKKDFD